MAVDVDSKVRNMNKVKLVCLLGLLVALTVFAVGIYYMNTDASFPTATENVFYTHLVVTMSGVGIFVVFGAGLQHQIEKDYWRK